MNDPAQVPAHLPEALRPRLPGSAAAPEDAAPPALRPYPPLAPDLLRPHAVTGRMIAYASPDSTYAVTGKLLDSAQASIVIGIYDFSAEYMKAHLKKAMQRGVRLSLMLDTNSADEPGLFDELRALGAQCVRAPSSSAGHPAACFGNAHEKIIVIDGEIVMIQSGNWSENSIPFNPGDGEYSGQFVPGNRDMGLAVHSPSLARFFAELVARDIRLSLGQPPEAAAGDVASLAATGAAGTRAADVFFEAAPANAPPRLFSSLTVQPAEPVRITPVITPENFHETALGFLSSARKSILVEQQYIRGGQAAIRQLLERIAHARQAHPDLDVRIIVSPKYLYGSDLKQFLAAMADFGLEFGTNFRYLSRRHFVHCHNKLVVVDGRAVLLGSQNWSTTGVRSNREAALLVEHAPVAGYFAEVFETDWGLSEPSADPAAPGADMVVAAGAFADGGVVPSTVRDYRDV